MMKTVTEIYRVAQLTWLIHLDLRTILRFSLSEGCLQQLATNTLAPRPFPDDELLDTGINPTTPHRRGIRESKQADNITLLFSE